MQTISKLRMTLVAATALVLLAPFSVGSHGEAVAQEQDSGTKKQDTGPVKTTTEQIGKWTLTCSTASSKTRCLVQQKLASKKNNQVVASARVQIGKDGSAELVFDAPTGVLIAPGVALKVDDKDAGVASFRACGPRGCEASAVIDQNLINTLASGKVLAITVQSVRGKGLTMQFQLDGFTKAYAAFKKAITQ